uniref:Transmembrane protein 201 n=1 Tax=Scleropages formosus TaxID=113540 RepID=A0A8C9RC38_SCLFO
MEVVAQVIAECPPLLSGGIGIAACAAGALIHRIATRKKPTHVRVNCWFCNQDTEVPYGNRNCWDCPYCEQYNGFQENGDYNKPIPAQYMEHLNHGVSAGPSQAETSKSLQWVNCQMLLCKKCNHNQSLKIKQLASFQPRDEEKYDEEIEVYRHHLEQTYKLCRLCQTSVEHYIKHQNRQLRALLFSHQLRRSRDSHLGCIQSTHSIPTPGRVILLRVLDFVLATFLVALAVHKPEGLWATQSGHANASPPAPNNLNASDTPDGSSDVVWLWQELLELIPDNTLEKAQQAWDYGRDHKAAVASLGLFICIVSIFLAGPVRLRRIDAASSILWFLLMSLHLLEKYVVLDGPGWLDTIRFCTTLLCCSVGFAAAVATRKSTNYRRARGRRYLSGGSLDLCYNGHTPLLDPPVSGSSSSFVPTPPPNLSHLINRKLGSRERRASPSSLPGRLNRALSLGTIPSLTCTDSGYLFSGSRPSSQCKDSPPSDYFSLKTGSRPSSPGPSPAPSIAGSVTSTSSSAHQRRPLISPARLQLGGKRLQLFSSHLEPGLQVSPCSHSESAPLHSAVLSPEALAFPSHSHGMQRNVSHSVPSFFINCRSESYVLNNNYSLAFNLLQFFKH